MRGGRFCSTMNACLDGNVPIRHQAQLPTWQGRPRQPAGDVQPLGLHPPLSPRKTARPVARTAGPACYAPRLFREPAPSPASAALLGLDRVAQGITREARDDGPSPEPWPRSIPRPHSAVTVDLKYLGGSAAARPHHHNLTLIPLFYPPAASSRISLNPGPTRQTRQFGNCWISNSSGIIYPVATLMA